MKYPCGIYPFGLLLAGTLTLSACGDADTAGTAAAPIRGLKTILVTDQENEAVRRYPSVLQPSEVTTLSFEIAGRLGENNLKVGQRVKKDQTLVELDPRSLELAADSAAAALDQANATLTNSLANLKRRETLIKKGATTQTALDDAKANAATARAQVTQADKKLASAREDLSKTTLKAPYDGIINTVPTDSFVTVSAGTSIATIYSPEKFDVNFSVSYEVINRLAVGKGVVIRLADNPTVSLKGHVSELGSRADTVSSFPVVVRLDETHPELKAGMAVEVSMSFAVTKGDGYPIPIAALLKEEQIKVSPNPLDPIDGKVFLYDKATQTVKRHTIKIGGIRENAAIIIAGLKPGDIVASAGVSFLREGQKVKLLGTSGKSN